MQDTVTSARRDLELADEALRHAEFSGAPAEVLTDLVEDVADAEGAYFEACSNWMPVGVSGADL